MKASTAVRLHLVALGISVVLLLIGIWTQNWLPVLLGVGNGCFAATELIAHRQEVGRLLRGERGRGDA